MRYLLAIIALLGLATAAQAQAIQPCIGVGGVNTTPQPGVVCAMESTMPTFSASVSGFAAASTATDVACLTGSASRVVRLQRVLVTGSAASTIAIPVSLFLRTAADSAGTAVVMTPFSMDTNNTSTVSNVQYFTANPTINDTLQAQVDVAQILLPTTTTSAYGITPFDYSVALNSQGPVLRGTGQQLCVNFNKTSPSTSLVNINFRWTEFPQ